MEYIHYGHSKFDPNRWNDVRGSEGGMFNKPTDGGLWASPVDVERGWDKWCVSEKFATARLKRSFRFELSPEARLLELTPENVWELPIDKNLDGRISVSDWRRTGRAVGIDFAKLAEDYDVLVCSISKYPELYWMLYGWDCDCILVLNKEVIVVG